MQSGKNDQTCSEETDAQFRAYEEQLLQAESLLHGANKAIAQYYKARGYPDFDFQHPVTRFQFQLALREHREREGR